MAADTKIILSVECFDALVQGEPVTIGSIDLELAGSITHRRMRESITLAVKEKRKKQWSGPRGVCSACGGEYSVTASGRIRAHGHSSMGYGFPVGYCDGTDMPPATNVKGAS